MGQKIRDELPKYSEDSEEFWGNHGGDLFGADSERKKFQNCERKLIRSAAEMKEYKKSQNKRKCKKTRIRQEKREEPEEESEGNLGNLFGAVSVVVIFQKKEKHVK